MEWFQVMTIILANVGLCVTLFLWLRKEANADRKEISASMADFRKEMSDFRKMWAQESREFHGRLCQIEERGKK